MSHRKEAVACATSADQVGVARVQSIQWSYPTVARLSDAARLIYVCLVDGCSSTARETIDSVELVWRNRHRARERYAQAAEMRDALDEICIAVEELITAGLLVLLDPGSIQEGWVRRPWEELPN